MKGNPHKKMTFEDRVRKVRHLGRRDRKVWSFWKRRNRKMFRKKMKQDMCANMTSDKIDAWVKEQRKRNGENE